MKNKLITKADLIIILAVTAAAAVMFFAPRVFGNGEKRAVIMRDGKTVYDIPLADIAEPRVYSAEGVKITVTQNGAYVSESDCRDKICVNTGMLCNNGDTSACVPNRVVVKIICNGVKEIDAVAY